MMTDSKREAVSYTEAQATRWLAWLARGMQKQGQTVFQIEQLQPICLNKRGELLAYLLSTRIVWGVLILGLGVALLSGTFATWPVSLSLGLVYGSVFGLFDFWRFRRFWPTNIWIHRHRNVQTMLGIVSSGLIGVLISGLANGVLSSNPLNIDQLNWLFFGFIGGSLIWLVCVQPWLIRGGWRPLSQAIQPVEILRWSWRSSLVAGRKGLAIGIFFGLIAGLLLGLSFWLFGESGHLPTGDLDTFGLVIALSIGLLLGLIWGLLLGLFLALVVGLIGGFRPRIEDMKTIPNQGIRLSLRNAIRIGVAAGSAVALLAGLPAPESALVRGLASALGFGLWFGGLEVVEHGILRFIIAVRGHAPLNYVRFLDYAAEELNFLQKVGGGYMFIHRYLLEYFAGLEGSVRSEPERPQPRAFSVE